MTTAETNEYPYIDDRHEMSEAELKQLDKGHDAICWQECLWIGIFILGYCAVMATLAERDQRIINQALMEENVKLRHPRTATCLLTQHNIIHQYKNCKVVTDHIARLN